MARIPIFHDDLDALKAQTRCSGIPDGEDAHAIFELAVDSAHVTLHSKLGSDRVAQIEGYKPADTTVSPVTAEEREWFLASRVERDYVMLEMLDRLPLLVQDGAAGAQDWYDKEAPFRDLTPEERATLRATLEKAINDGLSQLAGPSNQQQFGGVVGILIRNEEPRGPGPHLYDPVTGAYVAPPLGHSLL